MSETPPAVPPIPPTSTPPKNSNQNNRSSDEPVYEMLWKCIFCGTDKLRGKTQRFCPNCGAPQAAKNRYFPTEEDMIAVENDNYQGIDKLCAACGTANAAASSFCSQCGSAMDGTKNAELKVDAASTLASESEPPRKRSWWVTLLIFTMLLGITFFIVNYFWRDTVTLELVSSEWQREIKIEQLQAVQNSAWCDVKPVEAYSVSRKSEVRNYKQIPDGETCRTDRVDRGDGTFVAKKVCTPKFRNEPVYSDKCYFTVNRWQYVRSLTRKGTDKQPRDPELVLNKTGNCLGCERDAAHVSKYVLTLSNKSKKDAEPIVCEVVETIWQQANPESKWQMEQSVITDSMHCDTLKVAK
jgi:hypothetical protein